MSSSPPSPQPLSLEPPPFFPPDAVSPLLQTLAGAVGEAVLLVSRENRVLGVNEAACILFGFSYPPPPGQMVNQTVLEATHLRGLSDLCQNVARTANPVVMPDPINLVGREAEKRVRVAAYPAASGGGDDRPLSRSPWNEQAGIFYCDVLLVLSDQTELFRLQTVRTEFVANVSHELRTPLASIRATAETLLDGAMTDEPEIARRFLKTIIPRIRPLGAP